MFTKLWSSSKEMNFYGIIAFVSALSMSDIQVWIQWLPDTIETPMVAFITFVIGVAGVALRAFWRGGEIVWKKADATPPGEVEVIKAKVLVEKNKTPLEKAKDLIAKAAAEEANPKTF